MAQRLHLVFGGELIDPTKTAFKDVDAIDIAEILEISEEEGAEILSKAKAAFGVDVADDPDRQRDRQHQEYEGDHPPLGRVDDRAVMSWDAAIHGRLVVPPEQRAAYEKWMKGLLAAAPKSSPAAIRAVIEEDLGASITELYQEWDSSPIASASAQLDG